MYPKISLSLSLQFFLFIIYLVSPFLRLLRRRFNNSLDTKSRWWWRNINEGNMKVTVHRSSSRRCMVGGAVELVTESSERWVREAVEELSN